jgi:cell division protein FtsZ
VIINITGGADLSLVEISDASTIVQEAADEDANIIFGAVVDPALEGKIKITVIATGFSAQAAVARPAVTESAPTPVDMSIYADHARQRAVLAAQPGVPAAQPAVLRQEPSLSRRPLLDLPLAASAGGPMTAPLEAGDPTSAGDGAIERPSRFDVPAFLRRHEG